jgi:hypothetical protein
MSAARLPIYKTALTYLKGKQGYATHDEMAEVCGFGGGPEGIRMSMVNIFGELKQLGFVVAGTDLNDIAITPAGEQYLTTL